MTGAGGRAAIAVALIAACAALLVAAPARAGWRAVPVPAGGSSLIEVVVADSETWLAHTKFCCPPIFQVTGDGGASWHQAAVGDFEYAAAIGAASDGTFRLLARKVGSGDVEMQVFRVAADGDSEPLGPAIVGVPPVNHGAAVTVEGDAWLPYRSVARDRFELAVVAPDGGVTTTILPDVADTQGWGARETALGPRLLRFGLDGGWSGAFLRGTYRLDPEGEPVPAETYPVAYADGEFWSSSELYRASWDGGEHWAETPAAFVQRAPGLGMPRLLSYLGVAVRYSPSLFRATAVDGPSGALGNTMVDTGDALVVRGETAIFVHEAQFPPLPTAIGELEGDTRAMVERANQFRADAGLPPLIGDAQISLASRNHSAYSALHPDEMEDSAHEERQGKQGFTGFLPWDRCEAVGTSCRSEVMYSDGEVDPVNGWLATIYHRPLIGAPGAGVVGGGKVPGGWSVMNGGDSQGLLVKPFGYPNGRWRGYDGFSGESPDPVVACKHMGQPIEYPVGAAVSLYIPAREGSVSRIDVRERGSEAPLPGCLLHDFHGESTIGVFIPDDPLVRGRTYDAHGVWNPGADWTMGGATIPAADLSHDWSFHFSPDYQWVNKRKQRRPCRALGLRTIKSVAPARRRGRPGRVLGIEERVTLKQKALVRLRWARLNYWKAGRRYSTGLKPGKLKRRARRVGRVSYLRFRLPPKVLTRVHAGEEAELRLAFTGRRLSDCRRQVHIKRVRKISFGWVRVRGPAAWVSATRGKRR